MIEPFFLTVKKELFWQYNRKDPDETFRQFADGIDFYIEGRPHSVLGYLSPSKYLRQWVA